MPLASTQLEQALQKAADAHRLRKLKTSIPITRPEILLENRRVIDFCSNDYLGLSQHPALVEAAQAALHSHGVGTGGARLIGGTTELHMQLEALLARFKGTEAALVFNSGYQANVGILSGLVRRNEVIFADKLNHASLVDGAILSRAKVIRYPHLDMAVLESALAKTPAETGKYIVTDTVFSMDGDLAPLETLLALAERYDAWLILDEAHGTGVFGERHRSGLWETVGHPPSQRVILVGTFSKALGSFGAYVAASANVIQMLVQASRSFIYSTSLPPAVIAANMAAVQLVMDSPERTRQLWHNIQAFVQAAAQAGLPVSAQSPIIPIMVGDDKTTLDLAQHLLEEGFYVQAIRPPTVPEGTARLRITLCANHTAEQIERLAQTLALALK